MTSNQRRLGRLTLVLFSVLCLVFPSIGNAGGPLLVGRTAFGIPGVPITWNTSAPIAYRVDGGPLSKRGTTVIVNNAAGLTRVQGEFSNWQNVATTTIRYQYGGPIQATGSFKGGDVASLADYNAVRASCEAGTQSPIVFDADGTIVSALGLPPDIIGFASPCKVDAASGHIMSGFAVLNGQFQDGVNQAPNYELTAAQFDEAITHELGHFSGLDHSQINSDVLYSYPCSTDNLAGLPLMFPIAACQARSELGLPVLGPDDQAWISKLYPSASFSSSYGTISGRILFSDGKTAAQGVNVIARRVDDPGTTEDESRRVAVSVVSGYLFTGSVGQSVSGTNNSGYGTGSRDATLIGYYEIPVPPGTYTVEVEGIHPAFDGGSSVGPLDPPIWIPGPSEFWQSDESAFDSVTDKDPITVSAGQTVDHTDIILNGASSRFDQFEDEGRLVPPMNALPERRATSTGVAA